ncbi:hypothetical protein [Nocardioides sp. W7]|uniref:hypothetical protein n=1 Tax=Nocardioides sp. W7 TaxID=2931390 RepID=UPI001FD0A869|nr:hypothetical protein [Nocardioides sp. W7]
MTAVLGLLLAVGTGLASALVPLVNAEAYAVVAGARAHPALVAPLVLALAAGQTAGKLVLFESARRGAGRFAGKASGSRWTRRVRDGLRRDRTGVPMVLAAASLGLPPLAVVSLAAGASGQRRWLFGVLCLAGRVARFGALVLPLAWL